MNFLFIKTAGGNARRDNELLIADLKHASCIIPKEIITWYLRRNEILKKNRGIKIFREKSSTIIIFFLLLHYNHFSRGIAVWRYAWISFSFSSIFQTK